MDLCENREAIEEFGNIRLKPIENAHKPNRFFMQQSHAAL